MKNKLLTFLFVVLLSVWQSSLMAQTATAPSGSGTSGAPFEIATLNNLYWLAVQVNSGTDFSGKYFIQTANIDASSTSTWFSNQGWMPIGYSVDLAFNTFYYFSGNYDGQNYTISNLYMNRSTFWAGGLFGMTLGATISNIGLTDVSLSVGTGASGQANQYLGALIGYAYQGTVIDNCYATGSISGDQLVGGLIGSLDGSNGANTISNSFFNGSVTSNYEAGGLCGDGNNSTISQCYSVGSVTCTTYHTGGFIGSCSSTVNNCYSTSTVVGGNYSGGFLGSGSNETTLNYCYATGAVSGTSNVGGLIGYIFSAPSLTGCLWDTQSTGQLTSAGGGTGKTTSEMQTASTFTNAGWNTPTSYWSLIDGRYPQLLWATSTYSGTGNWSVSGNWSNGLPGTTTDAIISGTCTIDDNYGVANVTINSGAAVTVLSGKTLTVSGSVTVNSDATSNGSLLVEGTVSGNVTYNRYVTANNWHLLSSPVAGQAINDFSSGHSIATQDTKYGIALYDNTVPGWSHYTTANIATSGNFTSGKGYEMMRTAAGTLPFTGTINTSPVTIALTSPASPGKKWNLIGNPFTAALNVNTSAAGTNNFITVNASVLDASYQAIYIWDASASNYITVNQSTAATYIAPGQAFFVYSKDGGGNVSFTTAMQTNQTGNIFKSGEVGPASITLYASKGTVEKSTHIKYIENMTTGIDPGYDAGYFDGGDNSFAVYTQLVGDNTNTEKLDIQCLPTNGYGSIIPVGLNAVAGSEVTFSIETSNLPVGTPVYLEDKQTGAVTALEESGSYYRTVLQESSEGYGRFYLYTKELQTGIETSELSSIKVLTQPKYHQLLIRGVTSDNSSVELYDLFGRKLLGQTLQKSANNEVSMSGIRTGIYLVRIQDGGRIISQKISWLVD